MSSRFYVPDARNPGQIVSLSDDEAKHLTQVLRLRPGADVVVFDGRGLAFDAVVATAGRGKASVELGAARAAAPEARVAVTLAQAVLKGDKMDDIVRDAVMMGVAAIQPLVTVRSEVSLAALDRGRRRERWERIAVASAKQCGRAVVPPILAPCAFAPAEAGGVMLVEPSARGDAVHINDWIGEVPAEIRLLVGPEGGWAPEELRGASGHSRLVTLGGRTLRADAVAIAALAALYTVWRAW